MCEMFVFHAFFIFVLLNDSRVNAAVIPLELDKNDDVAYCIHEGFEGQIISLIDEMNEICNCYREAKSTCSAPFILHEICDTVAPIYRILSTSIDSCNIAHYMRPDDSKQKYVEDVCDTCIREEKKNKIKMLMDRNITSICECFHGYYTPACNFIGDGVTQNPKMYEMLDNYCTKTISPLNLILSQSTGPFTIADIPYISADIPSNSYHIKPLIFGTGGLNHKVSNFVPYKGNISKDGGIDMVPPRDSKRDGRSELTPLKANKLKYISWNLVTAKDDRPVDDAWDDVAPDVTKPKDFVAVPVLFNSIRSKDNGPEPALPKNDRSKDGGTDLIPPEGGKPENDGTDTDPSDGSKPKDRGTDTVPSDGRKLKDGGTSKGDRPKDGAWNVVKPVPSNGVRPKENGLEPSLPKNNKTKDGETDFIPPEGGKTKIVRTNTVPPEDSKSKYDETDTVSPQDSKIKDGETSKGNTPKNDAWNIVAPNDTKEIDVATAPVLSNGDRSKYHGTEPALPETDTSKDGGTYLVTSEDRKPKDSETDMVSIESSIKYSETGTAPNKTSTTIYSGPDMSFFEDSTRYGASYIVPPEFTSKHGESATVSPGAIKSKYGDLDTVTPKHSKPTDSELASVPSKSIRSKDPEPLPALPKCDEIETVGSKGGKPIKGNTAPSEVSKTKDHETFSTIPKVKPPREKTADTNLCFLKTINQNVVSRALCVLKALNEEN